MKKTKKLLLTALIGMFAVSSIFGGGFPVFADTIATEKLPAQEENKTEAAVAQNEMVYDQSSNSEIQKKQEEAISKLKSIRGLYLSSDNVKLIGGIETYGIGHPQVGEGTKNKPLYVSMVIPANKLGAAGKSALTSDEIITEEGYRSGLYQTPDFTGEGNHQFLPGDAGVEPVYLKIENSDQQEYYYILLIVMQEIHEPKSILGFNHFEFKSDQGFGLYKGSPRKILLKLKEGSGKRKIDKTDILSDDKEIRFFGEDKNFASTAGEVKLKQNTTVYFSISTHTKEGETVDPNPTYYELTIENPDALKHQNEDKKQQPPSIGGGGGGGGSHSSERPSPNKSDNKKTDPPKKDEKKDLKKGNEITENKTDRKISTKLTIGEQKYTVVVDGHSVEKTMDVAPMVHMGRTVLPARMISEILGVEVKFEGATKTASFMYGEGNKVELTLGQKFMMVNGKKIELTADVLNVNGRILLPLTDIQKAFAELGLKANVDWDAETKSVTVNK